MSDKLCEICNGGEHKPGDHPYIPKFEETHNPLDIPFGHEVQEVNMNVKDQSTEEGGMGSGRNQENPDEMGGGSQQGPLITFETLPVNIIKEFVDAKLNCPCNKKK